MKTYPLASESASGGSASILAGGSLASGTNGSARRISLADCAIAVAPHRTATAPIRPMNACLMTALQSNYFAVSRWTSLGVLSVPTTRESNRPCPHKFTKRCFYAQRIKRDKFPLTDRSVNLWEIQCRITDAVYRIGKCDRGDGQADVDQLRLCIASIENSCEFLGANRAMRENQIPDKMHERIPLRVAGWLTRSDLPRGLDGQPHHLPDRGMGSDTIVATDSLTDGKIDGFVILLA